jgi:predicted nucleotidyltransferase
MIKKEYEILMPFLKEPWNKFTFKDVKKLSKKKSESYVYDSIKKFVNFEILEEKKAGNVILYNINLKSLKTRSYSGFVSESIAWNKKHIPFNEIIKIVKKIPTKFFIFIITGSYSKQTQNTNSDLDIVIIVDDYMETKKVYSQIKSLCELSIPKIHPYAFKQSEFLQMLVNNEENYGKEIVKNNLIFFGAETYYSIINEAIENGFNDKKLH